jgi:hypothetical protein
MTQREAPHVTGLPDTDRVTPGRGPAGRRPRLGAFKGVPAGLILAAALATGCGGGNADAAPEPVAASGAVDTLVAAASPMARSPTGSPASAPSPAPAPAPASAPAPAPAPTTATRALPLKQVAVATVTALRDAVAQANASGGDVTIVIADGVYLLPDTLYVNAPNVALVSASNDRTRVTIRGDAMSATATVKNLVRVAAKGFQLRGISLERAGWHLIQIVGEADADGAVIRDCAMRDSWEQMLKISYDAARPTINADDGLVENCVFEYSAGIGPQYYIGGIDGHGSRNWVIRNNVFRNIASPTTTVAEHAIHFWSNSADILVERNMIIDCDRGVGFGLGDRGNVGGIIRNNYIHHTANRHPAADSGIILENSPNTAVYNNTVLLEHAYPRAIEYRFPGTSGVRIVNNLSNKAIASRDGGTGTVSTNVVGATRSMFRLQSPGDLNLSAPHAGIVDAGQALTGLVDDFSGDARPRGAGIDIGADEY